MKRMKKIVSILLAMVMVLGMSLTVFATEGGGDVTTPDISNTPDEGSRSGAGDNTETPGSVTHTYEIYQILRSVPEPPVSGSANLRTLLYSISTWLFLDMVPVTTPEPLPFPPEVSGR